MVIDDFNLIRAAVCPCKADAPLIIYANAPLALAVAGQLFQSVPRRHSKVIERTSSIEVRQLSGQNVFECTPLRRANLFTHEALCCL